jgi:hypothetical protein
MNDVAELRKVPIKVYESSDRLTIAEPQHLEMLDGGGR